MSLGQPTTTTTELPVIHMLKLYKDIAEYNYKNGLYHHYLSISTILSYLIRFAKSSGVEPR